MAHQGANFLSYKSSSSNSFDGDAMDQGKDFDEDVWVSTVGDAAKDNGVSSSAWHNSKAPRKIPKANSNNAVSSSYAQVVQGSSSSEPMDIPNYGKKYLKKGSRDGARNNDDEYDDDDDDDMSIPPHEWLAKKLARNQISSSSVCEGVGRTLKGRDLSKVRTTILTKTGFIE